MYHDKYMPNHLPDDLKEKHPEVLWQDITSGWMEFYAEGAIHIQANLAEP